MRRQAAVRLAWLVIAVFAGGGLLAIARWHGSGASAQAPGGRVVISQIAADGAPAPPLPATMRVWSDGDSTSYFMTVAFFSLMEERGHVPVRAPDYKISSGLVNRGSSAVLGVPFNDWPSYMAQELTAFDPQVVVFMIGANDAGYAAANPARYRELVGAFMDLLEGRVMFWVGQPAITRGDLAPAIPGLNAIYREEAAKRPWVTFVDASWLVPSAGDGVHLSAGDGRQLAEAVVAALDAR